MPLGHYEDLAKYKNKSLPFICRVDTLTKPQFLCHHWHESMEILYCTEGSGQAIINGSVFDFSPGNIIVVNPGQIHGVIGDSPSITYKCIILFDDFCKENGIEGDMRAFVPVVNSPEITRLYLKMYNDFHGGEATLKIRLDAMELLYALTKDFSTETQGYKETAIEGIKAAIDYINRNYSEDISLDTIAEVSNLSRFYFTRRFKDMTGKTFNDFLGALRCHKAAEMIKDGKTVSEVCFAVGYNDPAYFSRVFKKFMGVAPSKYK